MTVTLIVPPPPFFFVISVRLVQSDVFLLAESVALSEPVVKHRTVDFDCCVCSHLNVISVATARAAHIFPALD